MNPAEKTSEVAREGIVVLVFAQQRLDSDQWTAVLPDLSNALEQTSVPPHRFLDHENRVMELHIRAQEPTTQAECTKLCNSAALEVLQSTHGIELVIQPLPLYLAHKTPGLAVFDMDSTLIQQEVIDELARAGGFYAQVAAITEAAMRGEAPYTDFEASLRARVALLRGVPTTIWETLRSSVITFTPGAQDLIRVLRHLGWRTAVLSGGFTPLVEWVKETLGLDYAYANHLVSEGGILTGELVVGKPIIHAQRKQDLLSQLAADNGILIDHTIAVGDGSNDLLMLGAAGLGIAFNAKPKVQAAAPARLNSTSLTDILHVLGFTADEIDAALNAAA